MAPAFTASATEASSSPLVSGTTSPSGHGAFMARAAPRLARPGRARAGHGGVLRRARERHALHVGHRGLYGPSGLDAVHDGHHEVHQDHVGPGLAGKPERLPPVPGAAP